MTNDWDTVPVNSQFHNHIRNERYGYFLYTHFGAKRIESMLTIYCLLALILLLTGCVHAQAKLYT